MVSGTSVIPDDILISKIYLIRGQKVILDFHLSELYRVQTKVLKQAVRRNIYRFPEDFMFELTKQEFEDLRSQFVTSNRGGIRYLEKMTQTQTRERKQIGFRK